MKDSKIYELTIIMGEVSSLEALEFSRNISVEALTDVELKHYYILTACIYFELDQCNECYDMLRLGKEKFPEAPEFPHSLKVFKDIQYMKYKEKFKVKVGKKVKT